MSKPQTDKPSELTVAVGLSGGVDSSVAALLLKQQGYRVIGLTMQIWDDSLPIADEGKCGCYGPGEARDIERARALADELDIPYHTVPLADQYKETVLDYFRSEYLSGRTPNPCVLCNRRMKFGFLLDQARASGIRFDRFATGHYARVLWDADRQRHVLRKALDLKKDQTYFISQLSQEQLSVLILPLGELTKGEVRTIARQHGWIDLAEGRESQDFIEGDDYGILFEDHDIRAGDMVDEEGNLIGKHRGIIHYTIGQRRGLGIGGAAEPWYVTGIDAERNRIIVGKRTDLLQRTCIVRNCSWIALAEHPSAPFQASCRIRLRHREAPAAITPLEHGSVTVTFNEPQSAITPGQTAVFYDDDLVLGAGTIDRAG